jgi:hypothetical protein
LLSLRRFCQVIVWLVRRRKWSLVCRRFIGNATWELTTRYFQPQNVISNTVRAIWTPVGDRCRLYLIDDWLVKREELTWLISICLLVNKSWLDFVSIEDTRQETSVCQKEEKMKNTRSQVKSR